MPKIRPSNESIDITIENVVKNSVKTNTKGIKQMASPDDGISMDDTGGSSSSLSQRRTKTRGSSRITKMDMAFENLSHDDGIDSDFSDDISFVASKHHSRNSKKIDASDETIAGRLKRRAKVSGKMFDSKYFYDSVIDQISSKYKSVANDDAIIDMTNLKVISNRKSFEKRETKEIGFYGDNTLEKLRRESFRKPNKMNSSLMDASFNEELTQSTPLKPKKRQRIVETVKDAPKTKQKKGSENENRAAIVPFNYFPALTSKHKAQYANVTILKKELILSYACKALWNDREYQINCLKSLIEILSQNDQTAFILKNRLIKQAMKVFGFPVLPQTSNLIPRIIFNERGEPNFEFYFQSPVSPLECDEVFEKTNHEMIEMQRQLYGLITGNNYADISRNTPKAIGY